MLKSRSKKKYLIWITTLIFLLSVLFIPRIPLPKIPNSTRIFDKNGIQIGEILAENAYRHIPVKLDNVPNFLKDSIIAIEDQRFYKHQGIDFVAIARAFRNNIERGSTTQGASTITTQLIRNVYRLNKPRTIARKIAEFVLAFLLESQQSKEKILESYLGVINFGYMNFGVESAADFYFGKSVNQLTMAEIIALITIPKNPRKYNPYTNYESFKERFDLILLLLQRKQLISQDESEHIKQERLLWKENNSSKLPYIQDTVANILMPPKSLIDQGKLETTIDFYLSKKIEKLANATIRQLAWKNVSDVGVLLVDRKTNEIRVLIGGSSYYNSGGQVNSVFTNNQPGSTIKPFTYLLAFKDLGWTPETTILDLPVQYKTKENYTYTPQNFSLRFKGPVSVATALAESLNVPAVKTANEIGTEKLLKFLRDDLRITALKKSSDFYGLALTLGVGDMSLYQLTRAFGVFSNDGEICDLKLFPNQESSCKKVIDSKYTDMIEKILGSRFLRFPAFPMLSNLDFEDRFVVLKSGTSRKFSDNRIVGYTENFLIGVWVGNKDGSPMKGVSGASGAGDLFKKIVEETEPKTQGNLQQNMISYDQEVRPYVQITNPLEGSVYKISNQIPFDYQSLVLQFATNISYDSFQRQINGKNIEKTWDLAPGIHVISLILSSQGEPVAKSQSHITVELE
ncbi:MAG: transglycosylase domain-containing protein [Candidatus Absconditabacteria bacterium]|nr:transglycosylase domain-containing protein [Candidatus Absconditabacteria bacterium]